MQRRLSSHLSDSEYIVKEFPNTYIKVSSHFFGNKVHMIPYQILTHIPLGRLNGHSWGMMCEATAESKSMKVVI